MNVNNINNYVPWMEKYRPDKFNDIVLDPLNKQILKNVIETSYFPNLLFMDHQELGKQRRLLI